MRNFQKRSQIEFKKCHPYKMADKQKTKHVTFTVPGDYNVDPWLKTASAQEVAIVLDLASKLPRIVEGEKNEVASKLYAARAEGTNDAIRKVLQEASNLAENQMKEKLSILQQQVESLTNERNKLSEEWKVMSEKCKHAEIDLSNMKTSCDLNEKHLKEKHKLEIDRLGEDVSVRMENIRQEEQCKSNNRVKLVQDEYNNTMNQLQLSKVEVEQKLIQSYDEKAKMVELHSRLQSEIENLKRPMGRGDYGEFNVASIIENLGFYVIDTSKGEKKEKGYLDLLVMPEDNSVENMRIAIEVKNKQEIKKASDEKMKRKDKDVDDDIRTFQQRVADGIQNDLFDAAIFVSIRAHTKMGSPVVLEMFDDTFQRALAPVVYIGPEKGKAATPLTQEQLETQLYMMFCLLDQCHTIRKDICNGLQTEEIASFQNLFDQLGSHMNDTFVDLRKQENLIKEMSCNLTNIRCHCIKMVRSLCHVNGEIPWLQRNIQADWLPVYEQSLGRAATMPDPEIWNKLSKQKSLIENTIGKDAMFKSIRADVQAPTKRPRTDDTPS